MRHRPRRRSCRASLAALRDGIAYERTHALARLITGLENGAVPAKLRAELLAAAKRSQGAGARHHRHRRRRQELAHRRAGAPLPPRPGRRLRIAIISIDPSRRKSGGALLGDRIRMNAIEHPNIYMRSLATRDTGERDQQGAARRRSPRARSRGLRPGHRRDVGHRPGRRGDRAARRHVAVRDDAGVRRGEPAREDRHARLRRLRRDQQVRPQGRAGRAARRAQAVPAQPRGVGRSRPTRCRCSAPSRRASTTTA